MSSREQFSGNLLNSDSTCCLAVDMPAPSIARADQPPGKVRLAAGILHPVVDGGLDRAVCRKEKTILEGVELVGTLIGRSELVDVSPRTEDIS